MGSGATLDSWLSAAASMFPLPAQTAKAVQATDQELYAEPGNTAAVLLVMHNPFSTTLVALCA